MHRRGAARSRRAGSGSQVDARTSRRHQSVGGESRAAGTAAATACEGHTARGAAAAAHGRGERACASLIFLKLKESFVRSFAVLRLACGSAVRCANLPRNSRNAPSARLASASHQVGVADAGWPEARVAFLRDSADGRADDVINVTSATSTTTTPSDDSRTFGPAAPAAARADAAEAELEDVMSNCPPPWARASQLAEAFARRPQPPSGAGSASGSSGKDVAGLSLVEQWVALARTKERTVGQIDQVR